MSSKILKHKRIKRPTVLIKKGIIRKNVKPNKKLCPIYQKLKKNNQCLARALSEQKQESQSLFTDKLELLAENQQLKEACRRKDAIIKNNLRNSKEIITFIAKMTGLATNTVSVCNEHLANVYGTENYLRASTSSAGTRDSTRRVSTKSPARGVVKPMVSGHTITKPTINLSRVNMQRLQNINLSIIDESPSTLDRSANLSNQEQRLSRDVNQTLSLPERTLDAPRNGNQSSTLNLRANRISGSPIVKHSKRHSLNNSNSSYRFKHNSEILEIKSPCVSLEDVSRLVRNSQSINVQNLSTSSSSNTSNNSSLNMETSHMDCDPTEEIETVPQNSKNNASNENVEVLNSDSDYESTPPETRKTEDMCKAISQDQSNCNNSDLIDPCEGPSWLLDEVPVLNQDFNLDETMKNSKKVFSRKVYKRDNINPLSRITDGSFSKDNTTEVNYSEDTLLGLENGNNDEHQLQHAESESENNLEDNDSASEDERVDFRPFVTQRRGPSTKVPVNDEETDDFTLIMKMRNGCQDKRKQIPNPKFNIDELLQLTPLKPLLQMNLTRCQQPQIPDDVPEPTKTIQLTQKINRGLQKDLNTSDLELLTTKILPHADKKLLTSEKINTEDLTFSQLSTVTLLNNSDIRFTDFPNDNITQKKGELNQKRKTTVRKISESLSFSDEENSPLKANLKHNQKKKKTKTKDPSTAKVVLTKLNDSNVHKESALDDKTYRSRSESSVSFSRKTCANLIDPSSDSESSVASNSSRPAISRPRRQKAPKNLQEQTLKKKLRR